MEVFVKIAQFLLSLSIIVILHELGHFIMAKIFKTRVEKFYLFFNPWFSLFKYRKGETEYGLGWLPLGGYVKISGMIDESMDRESMKKPAQPWEFRAKPAWQRLLIMLAGVIVNFITAIIIYVLTLFAWGETYLPADNVKYGIVADSLAKEIGFQDGDKVISLDGQPVKDFFDIIPEIILNERRTVQVLRNDKLVSIDVEKKYIPYMLKGQGNIDARIPFSPFVIDGFAKESPARQAGIIKGDRFLGVNGETFQYHDTYREFILQHSGDDVTVDILRDGDTLHIPITVGTNGMIGVSRSIANLLQLETVNYGLAESVPAGISKGYQTLKDYIKQFKLIFSKETKGYESLGGFITIGSIFPGAWNWQAFWELTAFLSIILAFMNILPIPALDGGHVLFLLYEVVTGRKPSDKFMEYAQITGMIILLTLLLYANGNDIMRLLRK